MSHSPARAQAAASALAERRQSCTDSIGACDVRMAGRQMEGENLRGDLRVIRGTVALIQMFGYSTTVRSLSQGRASYSMETAGFREVPPDVAKRLSFGD